MELVILGFILLILFHFWTVGEGDK